MCSIILSSCTLTNSILVWIAKCSLSVYTWVLFCVDGCCFPFFRESRNPIPLLFIVPIGCVFVSYFFLDFFIASAVQTPDFVAMLSMHWCIWLTFSSLIQPSFGNGEPLLPRPLPASVVDSRISEKDNNDATGEDSDEEPKKVSSIKFALQFVSIN